ncbi:DNA-binding transcriptional ArsR family regulator [Rhizobium mongolense]
MASLSADLFGLFLVFRQLGTMPACGYVIVAVYLKCIQQRFRMPLPKTEPGITGQELQKLAVRAHEASDLLKAMAHQTRLLILCILANEEKTVSQIEELLGIQQAMVSQQLARLRMEGLVNTRRAGRMVYYSTGNANLTIFLDSLFGMFEAADPD